MSTMNAKINTITVLLGTILLLPLTEGQAQRGVSREKRSRDKNVVTSSPTSRSYKSNRYHVQPIPRRGPIRYPRRARIVRHLPYGYTPFIYGGVHFYFYAGTYYTAHDSGYAVILPPVGFRIVTIPPGYYRFMLGPRVYFYHTGVYYVKVNVGTAQETYEVVTPPVGATIEELPENSEVVVIDGENHYEHNGILYKKVYLDEGREGYEIVYVNQ